MAGTLALSSGGGPWIAPSDGKSGAAEAAMGTRRGTMLRRGAATGDALAINGGTHRAGRLQTPAWAMDTGLCTE